MNIISWGNKLFSQCYLCLDWYGMFAALRFLFLNEGNNGCWRVAWGLWLDWKWFVTAILRQRDKFLYFFFFSLRTGRIQRFAVKNTPTLPPLTMPANKPDRKKVKAAPQKVLGDRSEKDEAERDLEALVFGGDANDMWDKTGHELSDNEADQVEIYDENDAEEKEQGNDQVILYDFTMNRWYLWSVNSHWNSWSL